MADELKLDLRVSLDTLDRGLVAEWAERLSDAPEGTEIQVPAGRIQIGDRVGRYEGVCLSVRLRKERERVTINLTSDYFV